ncbi:MAG TPA: TlpA disulfide reductase family protein [Chitinophagaceae bacterium]|nr:TlpA disulfide reductase family protein [Chitinophagaceae bacterium]
MKSIFFLLAFLPSLLIAQGFTINGSVAGLNDGVEVQINNVNDNGLVAKTAVKGGKFTVQGTIPEPSLYWLSIGGEQVHIFLENGTISVSGTKKDLKNLKIEGGQSHKDFEQFRNIFNPLVGELNAAGALLNKASNEADQKRLMTKYDSLNKRINSEVEKFIAVKPTSFVSPFLLYITAQLLDDPMTLERRYNALAEPVRNSHIGKSLSQFIAFNKVGAVGTDALEFSQVDPAGKPVSLSSFRGKYVLVDFWASWCRPCRMENPNVVKAFNKFNNKNFTVLGISLDREKDPWIKAIEKDGLVWTQVSDLKFWENEVAQLYRVQGIPQNFLVDPNGKIVAKNLRGEALETKLCELLGCN